MSSLTGLIIVMAIAAVIVALCFIQDMRGLHLPGRSGEHNAR